MAEMSAIPFTKMHGAGNDFVVIDLRGRRETLSGARLRAIADRRRGVGCDQIVLIEPASNGIADVRFRFHNTDGSEAGACGNGTRCVADRLMHELARDSLAIETSRGLLRAKRVADGSVAVDMGAAQLEWSEIPLAEAVDTLHLPISEGPLADPVAVGMGNPHCVFFVPDAETIDIEALGPKIEHHRLFPERTNVEVVSVRADGRIRMRVWERGVGVTQACGSGVCAVVVAACRRGLIDGRSAEVIADGGTLAATWRDDGHVVLTGPVATSFTGVIETGGDG